MPRYLAALIMVVLPACAGAPKTPADDGRIDVVWNRIDDPHGVCQGISRRTEFFKILGCSKWNDVRPDGSRVCSIYAPMPRDERDVQRFATLGHELMHCFDGNWHDRWGHMNPREPQRAAAGGATPSKPATAAD